ncbi:hypothetical protein OEA41_009750 [Lepraria neglecta]|uniref:Uncharacterized protein n=1 Tax=Lepraria neglecta TaxID=209136 RepID=A0AAD9Z6E2_9LECA|nr:hypothetical protein OEA41_009750 [Lepraria neglecta]
MSLDFTAVLLALLTALPSLSHAQRQFTIQSSVSFTLQPSAAAVSGLGAIPSSFSILEVDTNANETVGELVEILLDENIPDNSSLADAYSNSSAAASTTGYLAARAIPTTISPMQKTNLQKQLSAVFNSTDNGAYNITIPGCIAGDDIIGDIEAPNGTMITNATFGNLITVLQLPGAALYNYTLTMMEKTLTDLNATLDKIICEGPQGAARTLLWPPSLRPNWRDPGASDGFVTTFLIGGAGVVSIAWGGTRLAIAKHWPTENITIDTEVGILAATGLVQYLFITGLFRLQSVERRWIGRAEAVVLNGVIWVGAQLIKFLDLISGSTCIQTDTARAGVGNVMNTLRRQAVVVGTGAGRVGGMVTSWSTQSLSSLSGLLPAGQQTSSSDNLPDLEAGLGRANAAGQATQIVGVGLPALKEVVMEGIQRQLSGNTLPGEVCE